MRTNWTKTSTDGLLSFQPTFLVSVAMTCTMSSGSYFSPIDERPPLVIADTHICSSSEPDSIPHTPTKGVASRIGNVER